MSITTPSPGPGTGNALNQILYSLRPDAAAAAADNGDLDAQLAQAIQAALSGSGTDTSTDPLIYVGSGTSSRTVQGQQKVDGQFTVDHALDQKKPYSELLQEFYSWTPEQRASWGQYLVEVGLIDASQAQDYQTLLSYWKTTLQEAAQFTAAGKKLTPREVASLMGSAGTDSSSTGYTGTKTATSTSVDLTDPATAKSMVNQVLQGTLQRDATPEEMRQFISTLNAAERANPSTTTTTQTYDNGDLTNTSSVTSGGITPQGSAELLRQEAMKRPEYGAVQSATTLFNALLGVIGSPA